MKTWQLVALLGGVGLVALIVIMKSSRPKATTVNSSYGNPGTAAGLAGLIGGVLPSVISAFNKPPQNAGVVVNAGTYKPDTSSFAITGNTLTDPNTGNTLVYGTD